MKKTSRKKIKKSSKKIIIIVSVIVVVIAVTALCIFLYKNNENKKSSLSYEEAHAQIAGHGFLDQWMTNADEHWRICKYKTCTDEIDRAPHSWDSGTVLSEPTLEKDGETKYVCTVCGRTKIETVSFESQTQIKSKLWPEKIDDSAFDNFSAQLRTVDPYIDADSPDSRYDYFEYSFNSDIAKYEIWTSTKGSTQTLEIGKITDSSTLESKRSELKDSALAIIADASAFTHDAEKEEYVANGDMTVKVNINGTLTDVTAKGLTVTFLNSNIERISFTYSNGIATIGVYWYFYDFGNTPDIGSAD